MAHCRHTGRPDLAKRQRRERDTKRLAELWAEADERVRELAAMLTEVDFASRDLDALNELGSRGRILWAHALALQKLTRKIAESG